MLPTLSSFYSIRSSRNAHLALSRFLHVPNPQASSLPKSLYNDLRAIWVRRCVTSSSQIPSITSKTIPADVTASQSVTPGVSEQPVIWPVSQVDDGTRLDRFIKRRAPGLPPGLIQKIIRQRRVTVNDEPAIRNAHAVRKGDSVIFPGDVKLGLNRGKKKPKADDVSLAEAEKVREWIVYRDARCAVLDKPAGVPVQKGGRRSLEELLSGLGAGKYWLIHRLDQEVSGALVVARDVGAAGLLAEYFRTKLVRKLYWGLVVGRPRNDRGLIDVEVDGKKAVTRYRVVQELDRHYSWLELEPRTGRKHQLRIHCAEGLGTPLVGDTRYGFAGQSGGAEDLSGFAGPGLHLSSRMIAFPRLTKNCTGGAKRAKRNESAKDYISVTVPLPPHMQDTWKRLGMDEKLVG